MIGVTGSHDNSRLNLFRKIVFLLNFKINLYFSRNFFIIYYLLPLPKGRYRIFTILEAGFHSNLFGRSKFTHINWAFVQCLLLPQTNLRRSKGILDPCQVRLFPVLQNDFYNIEAESDFGEIE